MDSVTNYDDIRFPQTNVSLNVAGIQNDSITDGPGLRFVLYVQGCPHHCVGCHNPQTHPFEGGKKIMIDQIVQRVRMNPLLSGITFSGGEPFCQATPLGILAEMLRSFGYEIAVYTGFVFEELIDRKNPNVMELLQQTDILVDGPFVHSLRDRMLLFRGSRNQRILDVHKSLATGCAVPTTNLAWNPS